MKALMHASGRGLLVLALGGWAIGCGNNDSSDMSSGSGTGGAGGSGTAGSGAGGSAASAGAGPMTMEQCVSTTTANMGAMPNSACTACVCSHDATAAVACGSDCWAFLQCYAANCGDVDPTDMAAKQSCALMKCMDSIAGASNGGTALGKVISMSCSDACKATSAGTGGSN